MPTRPNVLRVVAAFSRGGAPGLRAITLPLAALILYAFAFQGARGLWSRDEGRYVDVALEMLSGGDWIHPVLHHQKPHFSKPPFTYWALASSMWSFGRTEWAARFPNALAFAITTGLVFGLGRFALPERPWLPALVHATSILPYAAANMVNTDTLLAMWETLAVFLFVVAWQGTEGSRRRLAVWGMWAAFGLAFLTKGPPGLLPLLSLFALAGFRRCGVGFRLLLDPIGVLLFALVGGSWYVVVTLGNPGLWRYFLLHEVIGRVATAEFNRHPEWYGGVKVYAATFLIGALPWGVPLVRSFWRKRLETSPRARLRSWLADEWNAFLALWLALPLVILLFARSRLPLYVLPLFVPLSLIAARRLPWRGPPRGRIRLALALWIALLAAGRAAAAVLPAIHRDDRGLAEEISRRVDFQPGEVIFVGALPRYGLSFYMGAEVEVLEADPHWAAREGEQSVGSEIGTDDPHEEPRLYLVSPRQAAIFEAQVTAAGRRPRPYGTVAGLRLYSAPARDEGAP